MTELRILLTDRAILNLPEAANGRYLVRDTELKGFFVVVGSRKKTFTVQGDLREMGQRSCTVRVAIGDTNETTTRKARAIAKEYLSQIARGQHPKGKEKSVSASPSLAAPAGGITLRQAWERYRDVHMVRKNRSERTIESYRDHVERVFADWLDTPLKVLGESPALVAKKHDASTKKHGPYIANGSMRTLRAIYNHARKTNRDLPPDNPVGAIDWNGETRRNTAMGIGDLKGWFNELAKLNNPVRREYHLFALLSGSRPTALKELKLEHINLKRRTVHIPNPKGGAKRAFDIPLSRQMILCLIRAIRFGRLMHPHTATEWVFPADSKQGHLSESKEDRTNTLSKWGNDLRQTFRTIATAAGVSEFDARLLMNHAIPGANAGYITRHKLLENHLRAQQQAISDMIFSSISKDIIADPFFREWLGRGAGRYLRQPVLRSLQ